MKAFSPVVLKIMSKILVKKTELQQENKAANEQPALNTNIKKPIPVKRFEKTPVIDFKQNIMNKQELSSFLRELLGLPKNMEKLLAQLSSNQTDNEAILKLLQDKESKLETEVIKKFLENSSKEVINKLLKLLQQGTAKTENFEQLKQLISLVNQNIPQKNASPQEVLMHFLVLYLPWLPLIEQQNIRVELEKKKKQAEDSDEISLIVYVSTINLGRFKIIIILTKEGFIEVNIENIKDEQEVENTEKEEKILKGLLKKINTNIKDEKVQTKVNFCLKRQKNYIETPKKEVTINKITSISPLTILTAQKITQSILEADDKLTLLKKRKESASIDTPNS